MSFYNPKLPGDPNLPPGVSQHGIDEASGFYEPEEDEPDPQDEWEQVYSEHEDFTWQNAWMEYEYERTIGAL